MNKETQALVLLHLSIIELLVSIGLTIPVYFRIILILQGLLYMISCTVHHFKKD